MTARKGKDGGRDRKPARRAPAKARGDGGDGGAPDAVVEKPKTPIGPPVVGMGASAGGLSALGRFFEKMPADSGLAFVIVLHLDPTKESHAAQVLAPHT